MLYWLMSPSVFFLNPGKQWSNALCLARIACSIEERWTGKCNLWLLQFWTENKYQASSIPGENQRGTRYEQLDFSSRNYVYSTLLPQV